VRERGLGSAYPPIDAKMSPVVKAFWSAQCWVDFARGAQVCADLGGLWQRGATRFARVLADLTIRTKLRLDPAGAGEYLSAVRSGDSTGPCLQARTIRTKIPGCREAPGLPFQVVRKRRKRCDESEAR